MFLQVVHKKKSSIPFGNNTSSVGVVIQKWKSQTEIYDKSLENQIENFKTNYIKIVLKKMKTELRLVLS